MGEGALLLHRGLADDPAHLHARDAACVEGLAHRAAVQASAHVAQPRGDAGYRLEERAAARRLRGDDAQVHCRAGADEPPGRPGARDVAVRARSRRRLHIGRQGKVGGPLASLARLQQVLGAARPVDAAERRGDRVIGSQLAGLVVPYAQELRDLGVDEALLRELAELTGGSALESPRDAFLKARRQSRIAVEIWPWLVGLVAFLLIPDIALRRLGPGALARVVTLGRRGGDRREVQ